MKKTIMIELREKHIKELEKICQDLSDKFDFQVKQVMKLEKENAVLKAQIKRMRNFQKCNYQSHVIDCPVFKSGGHTSCKECPHWILQEALLKNTESQLVKEERLKEVEAQFLGMLERLSSWKAEFQRCGSRGGLNGYKAV